MGLGSAIGGAVGSPWLGAIAGAATESPLLQSRVGIPLARVAGGVANQVPFAALPYGAAANSIYQQQSTPIGAFR